MEPVQQQHNSTTKHETRVETMEVVESTETATASVKEVDTQVEGPHLKKRSVTEKYRDRDAHELLFRRSVGRQSKRKQTTKVMKKSRHLTNKERQ